MKALPPCATCGTGDGQADAAVIVGAEEVEEGKGSDRGTKYDARWSSKAAIQRSTHCSA